jgi:AbrB family looped-hinge helix DNA binding protein
MERRMAEAERLTTTISTKGQVILPKAIRERREWNAGTRLVVEETPEDVLLRPAPAFAATRPEDVFGVLARRARPLSVEEMEAGVMAEARRRHARD